MNLNVNVDLYNGLQNVKRLHRANLSLLASQYQLEDMSENVALLVANSYLQVLFSKEALAAQKLQLDITQRELERTKKLISSGVIPKGDIYEVEASLASQEKSVVDAQNAFKTMGQALKIREGISDRFFPHLEVTCGNGRSH